MVEILRTHETEDLDMKYKRDIYPTDNGNRAKDYKIMNNNTQSLLTNEYTDIVGNTLKSKCQICEIK